MNAPPRRRLAFDQNSLMPLIGAVRPYLPRDLQLQHIAGIDRRLSDLDDRPLFIALYQLGWHGLITNNYRMLEIATEIAAIVATKAIAVAVEGVGHDPLHAVGAVLLELPGVAGRLRQDVPTCSGSRIDGERLSTPGSTIREVAARHDQTPEQLWRVVRLSEHALSTPALGTP